MSAPGSTPYCHLGPLSETYNAFVRFRELVLPQILSHASRSTSLSRFLAVPRLCGR